MIKEILRKAGRRGATVAAVAALVAAGVGVSAGVANADGVGWYLLDENPTGHGVGVYSEPNSESAKVAPDVSSTSSSEDAVYLNEWVYGEDINNGGDVWYEVNDIYYGPNGGYDYVTGYVYGAYTDGNWNYDQNLLPPYH